MMHLKNGLETLTLQFTPGARGEFNYYEDAETTLIIKQLVHLQELRKIPRTEEPLVLFILVPDHSTICRKNGLIVLNFWLGTRLRQRSLFPMERMLSMSMMPRVKDRDFRTEKSMQFSYNRNH